jgi:hypothetical protein
VRLDASEYFRNIGQPYAADAEQAADELQSEIAKCLPEGWKLHRQDGPGLAWEIQWQGSYTRSYGVCLSGDLLQFQFTHGNNDGGAWTWLHTVHHALVIDAAAVRHYGISGYILMLIERYEPNAWGRT